DQVKIVL
uniref:Ovarian jelly-peptide 1 n=1 Tax=Sepia officinalis TaxID=6610 RepID=OJP1_SEPOF|nr:RecName: Full=Ovarian jelly-peptide 1; Short=OJP1 [Sepia officinalis]